MNKTIDTLQQRVAYSMPIMEKSFLARLIRGYYQNLESANKDASDLGITIPQGSYCVAECLISYENNNITYDIIDKLESLSTDDISIYALDGLNRNYITLLFINKNTANPNSETSISSFIYSLKHVMSINMTVGVGKWVQSVNEIGNSYMQASTALDYRFIKGRDTITFYSELENSIQHLDYNPKEQLDLLEMRILHGNVEETEKIINSIFNDIKSRQFPIFYARTFCYNIINSVLNSLYKMKKELNLREYQYLHIIALLDSQTIDELHKKLKKCVFPYVPLFMNITAIQILRGSKR